MNVKVSDASPKNLDEMDSLSHLKSIPNSPPWGKEPNHF
jgi:hypothetical protein